MPRSWSTVNADAGLRGSHVADGWGSGSQRDRS